VVLALCCARSGYAAADAAGVLGLPVPENVRVARVPCAGIVSTNVLLGLLNIGVDRVMVVGCPVDNCQNKHGSNLARQWVDTCRDLIANLGGDAERVSFHPIASNMPHLFAQRAAEVARGEGDDSRRPS
jgi:coenzyme F420-reducing hydrogenase delta subunit